MKFCGIDLHSNNSVIVVSDAEDRIVLQRRLPNDLEAILAALACYRGELEGVVVESTCDPGFLVSRKSLLTVFTCSPRKSASIRCGGSLSPA